MEMTDLPSRDILKAQAKRLRADMKTNGSDISHATALEVLAHQWGMRDWNTLAAAANTAALRAPNWHLGQRVAGKYLGQAFAGTVKAARQAGAHHWSLTVRFDAPVDVVESQHFTSLRRQVCATINATGITAQKTSNGQPHMIVTPK